jgi:hypothetical protein
MTLCRDLRTNFGCRIGKGEVVKGLSDVESSFETDFRGFMPGEWEKINRARYKN